MIENDPKHLHTRLFIVICGEYMWEQWSHCEGSSTLTTTGRTECIK